MNELERTFAEELNKPVEKIRDLMIAHCCPKCEEHFTDCRCDEMDGGD